METSPQQWKFIPTPQDEAWGLYVTAVQSGASAGSPPSTGWRLHYLVRGAALLAATGRRRQRIEAGEVLLMDARAGCTLLPEGPRSCRSYQVDFAGAWMERWVAAGPFGALPRVIRAGFDENLLGLLVKLVELARHQPPGTARLMAGNLGNLLARLEVAARIGNGAGRQGRLVQDARRLLSDPDRDQADLEATARELGVSYSWFRRAFRTQTGLAPQRYRLLQRLDQACQLLADSSAPVGEISRRLGFSSQAYFARMFRKETGLSPSVWRAQQLKA